MPAIAPSDLTIFISTPAQAWPADYNRRCCATVPSGWCCDFVRLEMELPSVEPYCWTKTGPNTSRAFLNNASPYRCGGIEDGLYLGRITAVCVFAGEQHFYHGWNQLQGGNLLRLQGIPDYQRIKLPLYVNSRTLQVMGKLQEFCTHMKQGLDQQEPIITRDFRRIAYDPCSPVLCGLSQYRAFGIARSPAGMNDIYGVPGETVTGSMFLSPHL